MKQNIHQSSPYTNINNNIFDQYNESNLEYAPHLDHQMSSYQTPHFTAKAHPQLIC
ncbi:MAG: hypothetical protein ACMG6E_04945 [Candidatus Roizmanbacteria bacterium]